MRHPVRGWSDLELVGVVVHDYPPESLSPPESEGTRVARINDRLLPLEAHEPIVKRRVFGVTRTTRSRRTPLLLAWTSAPTGTAIAHRTKEHAFDHRARFPYRAQFEPLARAAHGASTTNTRRGCLMVTDLPARPLLTLVTTKGDKDQADNGRPALDDDGDLRQCGRCGFTFPVDDAARAEPARWVCPPCVVASLGGGSLQQRAVHLGGSTTQRTVFTA